MRSDAARGEERPLAGVAGGGCGRWRVGPLAGLAVTGKVAALGENGGSLRRGGGGGGQGSGASTNQGTASLSAGEGAERSREPDTPPSSLAQRTLRLLGSGSQQTTGVLTKHY